MAVIVLDVGKTNLKASVIGKQGTTQSFESENRTIDANEYRVQDLDFAWNFFFTSLFELSRKQSVTDVVVSTHGSSGMLVNKDNSTTPLPDYESVMPVELDFRYAAVADDLNERGASIGQGATHIAKQLLWIGLKHPDLLDNAETLLPAPQYWAWRLSGEKAMDITSLTAQSHLWNAREKRFTHLVDRMGWRRLMAPVQTPSFILGELKQSLVSQCPSLAGVRVRCGVHDSAANFHRYQAAGFQDFTLLSCGTWLVGLSDISTRAIPDGLAVTFSESAMGVALTSCRAMAGREFELLSGGRHSPIAASTIEKILAQKTMALPSFTRRDGLVRNSAGKGTIVGPAPSNEDEAAAVALVYYTMLADLCCEYLGRAKTVIVDGNITKQPMLGALLAALDVGRDVLISTSPNGTAVGAAMLAGLEGVPSTEPTRAQVCQIRAGLLKDYHQQWRSRVAQMQNHGGI